MALLPHVKSIVELPCHNTLMLSHLALIVKNDTHYILHDAPYILASIAKEIFVPWLMSPLRSLVELDNTDLHNPKLHNDVDS